MKALSAFLIVVVVVVAGLWGGLSGRVAAQGPILTTTVNNGICTDTSYSYPGMHTWSGFPTPNVSTIARYVEGTLVNSAVNSGGFAASGSFGWTETRSGYGPYTQPYSIESVQTFTYDGKVFIQLILSGTCSGGVLTMTSEVKVPTAYTPKIEYPPLIPGDFVLRTITCTTPVVNTPGGSPVGNNQVVAGQSWYVNPEPTLAEDGTSWTEIFVSSDTNPYIPTACVQ